MIQEIDPSIRELYPDLSSDQQEEAQYSLQRYVELIFQIYERTEAEGSVEETMNNAHLRKEWEKRNKNSTNH